MSEWLPIRAASDRVRSDNPLIAPLLAESLRKARGANGVSGHGDGAESDPAERSGRRGPYWPAAFFGLDRVSCFRTCPDGAQRAIVAECSRRTLDEAWDIERIGLTFAAKMILLAESDEERALFCCAAADEAAHFAALVPFVQQRTPREVGAFLRYVYELVERGNRTVSGFIINVLLEGWGLAHYHVLAEGTLDPHLARTLRGIIQDEARHHRTGVALMTGRSWSTRQIQELEDPLIRLFALVQAGPQQVVSAITDVIGPLTRNQRIEVFTQLDTEASSHRHLQRLRRLIPEPVALPLTASLERLGALDPWPATRCADA